MSVKNKKSADQPEQGPLQHSHEAAHNHQAEEAKV